MKAFIVMNFYTYVQLYISAPCILRCKKHNLLGILLLAFYGAINTTKRLSDILNLLLHPQ